jgi:type 1 glutamine amidotransferase
MTLRALLVAAVCAAVGVGVAAQQPDVPSAAPAAPAADAPRPIHVYIRAGLKSHGEGLHDYPQFLADWSKILTEHGAIVDGSLHFPDARELANVDVLVMYKGDAGYMTADEKAAMETFIKRGGGIVSLHDTLCGDDPAFMATLVGGGKKHGEVNYSAGDIKYTIVDKASPIMKGLSDFTINDEAFFKMTWASDPKIHVLATAPMPASGEVVPQIWTYEHTIFGGQPARAFVWMQGHRYANFVNPNIEPMLLRGMAWVARAPIDTLVNGTAPVRGGGRGGRAAGAAAPGGAAPESGAPSGRAGRGR